MKASRFAASTRVPVEKTRAVIDRLLTQSGATQTAIGADLERRIAVVAFGMAGARYRIEVPLPIDPHARGADQLERTRWRCLLLLIKAKLEVVRLNLSTIEREFMADLILPNGKTVGQSIGAAIHAGLFSDAPRMLPESSP